MIIRVIYKKLEDGSHWFTGGDNFSVGLCAVSYRFNLAYTDTLTQLMNLLNYNHRFSEKFEIELVEKNPA